MHSNSDVSVKRLVTVSELPFFIFFILRDDGGEEESTHRGRDVSPRREFVQRRRVDRFRLQHDHRGDQQGEAFTVGRGGHAESQGESETTPGGSVQQVSSSQFNTQSP